MNTMELCREATRRGLRLEPRGNKLAVIPAHRCPPEFADLLRQHKGELLALLEGNAATRTMDCGAWLHVARQILFGEFNGADCSTRERLFIGLRSFHHPLCQQALACLKSDR